MCAQGGAYGAVWGSSSLTTLAAGAYQPGVTLVAVTSASQKLFTCLVPTNPYSVQTKDVTGFFRECTGALDQSVRFGQGGHLSTRHGRQTNYGAQTLPMSLLINPRH